MPFPKKRRASSASDSEPEPTKKPRTSKKSAETKSVAGGGVQTADGGIYWEIAAKRRVVVDDFKGKPMVSVREYYEKDGEDLPGRKGITMPVVQFAALIEALPHIETILREKGVKLPRPDYDGTGEDKDEDTSVNMEDEEKERKRNIDATSDEDG